MPTTHRLFSYSHVFCSAMPPAYTTLMSASPAPPITSMPAKLTTCSAIARAAAHEDASLDVLEPKTHACLLPMAAATHVNALLQECDDVVLAGLPLALLLPGHARHRNGILSGVMPPMLSRAEVRPGVLRHFCGDWPTQVMYKRLIGLSRVSAFAATVVSTKGTDGARRPCADS